MIEWIIVDDERGNELKHQFLCIFYLPEIFFFHTTKQAVKHHVRLIIQKRFFSLYRIKYFPLKATHLFFLKLSKHGNKYMHLQKEIKFKLRRKFCFLITRSMSLSMHGSKRRSPCELHLQWIFTVILSKIFFALKNRI